MNYQEITENISIKLIKSFPREMLREYKLVPWRKSEQKIIFLSSSYPPLPKLDELESYAQAIIEIKIINEEIIDRLINEFLDTPLDTVEGMLDDFDAVQLDDYADLELDTQVEDLEELAHEAPIVRLVNTIITTGLKKEASDIHIEPFENKLSLRYRIDGFLYEESAPPKNLLPAIVTRIKIMSNLDIAERRLPQDGRIRIKVLGRELDIRVSIIPTIYGESIVLRLLDKAAILLELDNLGFDNNTLDTYHDLITQPYGIILVTGPTGSGKTTTLYATLNHLNSPDKKIITIEDPVEYQLTGINQIHVKPEIDFTFSRGLRSILRHDPDIIMIGEIRDLETAEIAIQAALTGHLVFATLHTNDSVGAITRLLEMGVEDHLLASSLQGVMAQRLVRVLCSNCKESYYPDQEELKFLDDGLEVKQAIYKTKGCNECNEIGFDGRTSIHELLPITQQIEHLITHHQNINEIKIEADNFGMKTLFEDGWEKVNNGATTIDEILRVTKN